MWKKYGKEDSKIVEMILKRDRKTARDYLDGLLARQPIFEENPTAYDE